MGAPPVESAETLPSAERRPHERLDTGDELGRYAIEALVGEGGMGKVYRARDRTLDRPVALKVLHGGESS